MCAKNRLLMALTHLDVSSICPLNYNILIIGCQALENLALSHISVYDSSQKACYELLFFLLRTQLGVTNAGVLISQIQICDIVYI